MSTINTQWERPGADGRQRGRDAQDPGEIPGRGWLDILWRVWGALGQDHVSLVAAGLAMYALLAVFPLLIVAVSAYGLFSSPSGVISDMAVFREVLPPGSWDIFASQLQDVTRRQGSTLTATAALALLLSLWSARSGMSSIMTATNIAYSENEKRGFIRQTLISLGFTAGAVLGFLLMLLLGVATPIAVKTLHVGAAAEMVVGIVRWLLLWLVAVGALAVVYRYAPARNRARWNWVTWGSAFAASVWIVASLGFSLYVQTFAAYGRTYGALGGVVVLLMWFYISSYIVVLGAEINAEMERQTRRDTTQDPEKPLGQRGAFAADTVGPSRDRNSQ